MPATITRSVGTVFVITPHPTDHGVPVPLSGHVVVHSSSSEAIAPVTPSGIGVARAPGVAVINTSVDGVSDTTTVTVIPAVVVARVVVTTPSGTIPLDGTLQASAIAYDSLGAPIPGAVFDFESGSPLTASVNSGTGLITGLLVGPVTINATTGGVTGSIALMVDIPTPTIDWNLVADGYAVSKRAAGISLPFLDIAPNATYPETDDNWREAYAPTTARRIGATGPDCFGMPTATFTTPAEQIAIPGFPSDWTADIYHVPAYDPAAEIDPFNPGFINGKVDFGAPEPDSGAENAYSCRVVFVSTDASQVGKRIGRIALMQSNTVLSESAILVSPALGEKLVVELETPNTIDPAVYPTSIGVRLQWARSSRRVSSVGIYGLFPIRGRATVEEKYLRTPADTGTVFPQRAGQLQIHTTFGLWIGEAASWGALGTDDIVSWTLDWATVIATSDAGPDYESHIAAVNSGRYHIVDFNNAGVASIRKDSCVFASATNPVNARNCNIRIMVAMKPAAGFTPIAQWKLQIIENNGAGRTMEVVANWTDRDRFGVLTFTTAPLWADAVGPFEVKLIAMQTGRVQIYRVNGYATPDAGPRNRLAATQPVPMHAAATRVSTSQPRVQLGPLNQIFKRNRGACIICWTQGPWDAYTALMSVGGEYNKRNLMDTGPTGSSSLTNEVDMQMNGFVNPIFQGHLAHVPGDAFSYKKDEWIYQITSAGIFAPFTRYAVGYSWGGAANDGQMDYFMLAGGAFDPTVPMRFDGILHTPGVDWEYGGNRVYMMTDRDNDCGHGSWLRYFMPYYDKALTAKQMRGAIAKAMAA